MLQSTQMVRTERKYNQEIMTNSETIVDLITDENISDIIKKSNKSGNHSEILEFIRERNLSLMSHIKGENGEPTVLLKILLVDVVNGHKIVKTILDSCIRATCDQEDSIQFAIEMDWSGMLNKRDKKQTSLLFHLMNLQANHSGPFSQLLSHPVVATFITLKWKKSQKFFYTQSGIFIAFLLLYSTFIIYLFNRPENSCSRFDTKLPSPASIPCQAEDYSGRSSPFLNGNQPLGFLVCEILFLTLTLVLTLAELYQAMKLRRQYFKEIENYFEWFVLISAFLSMVFKEVILQESPDNPVSSYVRGFTSLGICFAWFELIFIIGRYPFSGGDFSIMFYTVIKKLARYMIAMFCMIIGHAFAFTVINYGQDVNSFGRPFKSVVQTLTIMLGEFDFDQLYNGFQTEGGEGVDKTSRSFAMILLILLILFGTVTMVNLFIAAIMSDLEQLKRDVVIQNFVFTAQCSLLLEELLPDCLLERVRLKERKVYCVHHICPADCSSEPLPREVGHLAGELIKLAS